MWESVYISLREAAELIEERANCNGRRMIEAAWREGAIVVEKSIEQASHIGRSYVSQKIWKSVAPFTVEWYYNPYYPIGPNPETDLRVQRVDVDRLWPPQPVNEIQTDRPAAISFAPPPPSLKKEGNELSAKKRGPRPEKAEKVTQVMLDDLRSGRFTHKDIAEMKQEAGAETYGVSRETFQKARVKALSEFPAVVNSDK